MASPSSWSVIPEHGLRYVFAIHVAPLAREPANRTHRIDDLPPRSPWWWHAVSATPVTPSWSPMQRCAALTSLILLILLISGCDIGSRDEPLISARLYLGLTDAKGPIPPAAFAAFADTAITPLFPAGFTVYHADGQWQTSDHALVKEPSVVIELIYPDNDENRQRLLTLIEKIKTTFKQRTVLLVVNHGSINFY
jgi:hypothetical protein